MVGFGVVAPHEVKQAIDFDQLVLLFGMMIVSAPPWLAAVFLSASRKELRAARIEPHPEAPKVNRRMMMLALLIMAAMVAAFFLGYPLAWSALVGAALLMMLSRQPPREVMERV